MKVRIIMVRHPVIGGALHKDLKVLQDREAYFVGEEVVNLVASDSGVRLASIEVQAVSFKGNCIGIRGFALIKTDHYIPVEVNLQPIP